MASTINNSPPFEMENYEQICDAIRHDKYKQLKKLGLNKENVNSHISATLKISPKSKKPFISSIQNATPLIYAILSERANTLIYLITKLHASLDESLNGWFPIHFAAAVSTSDVLVSILQIEGTEQEPNRKCSDGSTPLHIACGNDNIKNVLILLGEGSDPNIANENGNTPLHICAKKGNTKIAKCLLAGGANTEIKNKKGYSPLKVATNNKQKHMIKLLNNASEYKETLSSLIKKYIPDLAEEEEEVEEEEQHVEEANKSEKEEEQQVEEVNKDVKEEEENAKEEEEKLEPLPVPPEHHPDVVEVTEEEEAALNESAYPSLDTPVEYIDDNMLKDDKFFRTLYEYKINEVINAYKEEKARK